MGRSVMVMQETEVTVTVWQRVKAASGHLVIWREKPKWHTNRKPIQIRPLIHYECDSTILTDLWPPVRVLEFPSPALPTPVDIRCLSKFRSFSAS